MSIAMNSIILLRGKTQNTYGVIVSASAINNHFGYAYFCPIVEGKKRSEFDVEFRFKRKAYTAQPLRILSINTNLMKFEKVGDIPSQITGNIQRMINFIMTLESL